MKDSIQNFIKQQHAHEEMVSKFIGATTLSDSITKSMSIGSLSGALAYEKRLSGLDTIREYIDKEKLSSENYMKLINPVIPSYISDAISASSMLSRSGALGQFDALLSSSMSHQLTMSEAYKNFEISSSLKELHISDAIRRLTGPISTSIFASEALALDQFKGLSYVAQAGNAFSEANSKALRSSLGDWRETLAVPTLSQTLYIKHGFDRGLTELPHQAFYDVVAEAGLTDPNNDIELFGPVVVDVADENLSQEELNAKCYARIYRLETRLRSFIDEAMTARFGSGWFKQLPHDVKENLRELQEKKRNAGQERTLIECTDFSHYVKILFKGDLWRDVFSPLFGTRRKEDVLESLNRLKPIRDTAMHSNSVSHEDWVMLHFETGRLLKVISKLH